MSTIGNLLSKINLDGRSLENEPLSKYTTFQIGGPADCLIFPGSIDDVVAVHSLAEKEGLPLFVMGRGANLLVSDEGIRGLTLNLSSLQDLSFDDGILRAQAGVDVSSAADLGRVKGFSCLEFLNAMPSSIGGAVFMNARCYGSEIADVLIDVTVLRGGKVEKVPFDKSQWEYKVSPFQDGRTTILEARFQTRPANPREVQAIMAANAEDRESKGHFRLPCAGSVFKNNHEFGAPSGVLIDQAGLKGLRRGNAAVSSWHGNIFVNEGQARAGDLRDLIEEVKTRVFDRTGFLLEEEVIFAGDWREWVLRRTTKPSTEKAPPSTGDQTSPRSQARFSN